MAHYLTTRERGEDVTRPYCSRTCRHTVGNARAWREHVRIVSISAGDEFPEGCVGCGQVTP